MTGFSGQHHRNAQHLMRVAMMQLNLSARAFHCILKLSRTIADLAGIEEIVLVRLAKALQCRPKLMMGNRVFTPN
jgi:magnesium chelatase family protein